MELFCEGTPGGADQLRRLLTKLPQPGAALWGRIVRSNWELRTISIRVLWVEDDEHYREVVGEELADRGFAVRSFADGAALLSSLDAVSDADIIVLDWGLPTVSGIDLLPRLRENGVRLPVVFLTSRSPARYGELAFSRGAQDFIEKTRDMDGLVERLRLAVQR